MSSQWFNNVADGLPVPTFWGILGFRIINSLTINTFFQADEYWQALEPAHKVVFGYGYLTWEWEHGLRSYLHPLLYMLPYWIVKQLDLDYSAVLAAPKIVNAIVAATGEYYLYHYILQKFKNKQMAKLVLYLSIFSVWNWYCWCRSFANSFELSFTIVSLYHLECQHINRCLTFAAITCLIRPTNAIVWLYYLPGVFWRRPIYILNAILIGSIVIGLDSILNYTFYSEFKIPLLNFFMFNVSDSLSSFYGVSRVDFYIFQALPILLLNYLPLFIYGISSRGYTEYKGLIAFYIGVFTVIPHKEFRFIYPLMPMLLTFCARGLIKLSSKFSKRIMKTIIFLTLIISVMLQVYFSRFHEVGEIEITKLIREYKNKTDDKISIGFLTPCHSTPFQSHIHIPTEEADIWFLTCEPPLATNLGENADIQNYMDESDYFYDDPVGFMERNFHSKVVTNMDSLEWPHEWPNYIIMFEDLWQNDTVSDYLNPQYKVVEKLWNAPFHWDSRRRGDVLLLVNYIS